MKIVGMSKDEDLKTVGEVSRLLGVSVRTLHYWEERGLVSPSTRSWSEYRLYADRDIAKLQQIMVYRATGMSLNRIAEVMTESEDKIIHLRRQRDLLMEKQSELGVMLQALDQLLEDAMGENNLSVEDIAGILGDSNFPAYQEEAERRWSDTEDWKISRKRLAAKSSEDWQQLKDYTDSVEGSLAQAMQKGVQPESAEAQELAEAHRQLLSAYYPVSHSKHVILARMYVEDPRFKEHYDHRQPGLAQWLKEIIDANAASKGIDPATAQWE